MREKRVPLNEAIGWAYAVACMQAIDAAREGKAEHAAWLSGVATCLEDLYPNTTSRMQATVGLGPRAYDPGSAGV
jgi:hypothetical protein